MLKLVMGPIDFILHTDQHLLYLVAHFGLWPYLLLFGLVFVVTGAEKAIK